MVQSRVSEPPNRWYTVSNIRGSTMPTTTDRITKTPGVCGGDACVRGTRITVWGLVEWRQMGKSDDWILAGYPTLTPADLQAAWGYAAAHLPEIEEAVRLNREA